MFPYPSGAGLHVGHPLGYIGTDCYSRYLRMLGYNVLHPMGFDAFGLPAEQYAVQTGTHPRTTTEANVNRYRAQLRRLGLAYDDRRSLATTEVGYYRWTQWIFLQIFNSWYDSSARRARPIDELIAEFDGGRRSTPDGRPWAQLSDVERRRLIDDHRLAYVSHAPVNWCPGLGTVLANEEVTADGRSERGNFPVFKRSLKQWMMRITAYGDRLLEDLEYLDWPEAIKAMQRNWIGRSTGAHIDFPTSAGPLRVFTPANVEAIQQMLLGGWFAKYGRSGLPHQRFLYVLPPESARVTATPGMKLQGGRWVYAKQTQTMTPRMAFEGAVLAGEDPGRALLCWAAGRDGTPSASSWCLLSDVESVGVGVAVLVPAADLCQSVAARQERPAGEHELRVRAVRCVQLRHRTDGRQPRSEVHQLLELPRRHGAHGAGAVQAVLRRAGDELQRLGLHG